MLIIYLTQAWKGTWTTGNYKIQLLESLLSTQRKQRHDTPTLQTSKVDDHMACSSWNPHDLGSQAADHTAVSETRSWTITDVLAAILTIQLQQSCLQPQRGGHGFSQHTQLSSSHRRAVKNNSVWVESYLTPLESIPVQRDKKRLELDTGNLVKGKRNSNSKTKKWKQL